ncbi:hypothetical protein H5410_024048 [Solanum commersonii]|uniref:Uncharacterized protein n=1 Tax=Solanum commersonii TaxID=4109 RepID=A0A9J5ZKW0_SOLCO|nr:hypothetical protein H5410_024048 [Solanum commersonii]
MDLIFAKKFLWTSVKTLAMEQVGPHSQNVPFSRSNESRSSYGVSSPSRQKCPIFKVKRDPNQVNPPFCQFSCAIVYGLYGDLEFRSHVCQNFWWTSVKNIAMEPVGPHGQNIPFLRSNEPRSSYGVSWPLRPKHPIFKVKRALDQLNPLFCQFSCAIVHGLFGDLQFGPHFYQKFLWTSIRTLTMEPVNPYGQNVLFSNSNEPRSRCPSRPRHPIYKVKQTPEQVNPQFCQFSCSIVHGLFGDLEFRPIFAKIFCGRPSRPKRPIYKVKRSPEQVNPPFCQFSYLSYGANWTSRPKHPILKVKRAPEQSIDFLVIWNFDLIFAKNFRGLHGLFGDMKFRPYFCQIFSCMSFKAKTSHLQGQMNPGAGKPPILSIFTSSMKPVGPHTKTAHFQGQMIPGAGKPPILPTFICYSSPFFLVIWNSNLIFTKNFVDAPDQVNPAICRFSCAISRDFLVIWNFELIFAKNFRGHPFRPLLWIQLALTAKTSHFQGQRSIGADLSYGANWPSRQKCPIFKVKWALDMVHPPFYRFLCAIVHGLFGDLEF